ncbi:MAG: acylphosphatase [Phycisphaerales bacterium]|nr:acylphosphatase [Phycisphaerales bacterium]
MSNSRHIQQDVVFHGNVQGVGFRYTTQQIAGRHEITGWVMNRPDRTVQCVVEGEPAIIRAFIAEVQEAMAGHIAETRECQAMASGVFSGFEVRYA